MKYCCNQLRFCLVSHLVTLSVIMTHKKHPIYTVEWAVLRWVNQAITDHEIKLKQTMESKAASDLVGLSQAVQLVPAQKMDINVDDDEYKEM